MAEATMLRIFVRFVGATGEFSLRDLRPVVSGILCQSTLRSADYIRKSHVRIYTTGRPVHFLSRLVDSVLKNLSWEQISFSLDGYYFLIIRKAENVLQG